VNPDGRVPPPTQEALSLEPKTTGPPTGPDRQSVQPPNGHDPVGGDSVAVWPIIVNSRTLIAIARRATLARDRQGAPQIPRSVGRWASDLHLRLAPDSLDNQHDDAGRAGPGVQLQITPINRETSNAAGGIQGQIDRYTAKREQIAKLERENALLARVAEDRRQTIERLRSTTSLTSLGGASPWAHVIALTEFYRLIWGRTEMDEDSPYDSGVIGLTSVELSAVANWAKTVGHLFRKLERSSWKS